MPKPSHITEVDIAIAQLYLRRQTQLGLTPGESSRRERCNSCPPYDGSMGWTYHYNKNKHWMSKTHITEVFNIPMSRLNQAIKIAKVMQALE